MGLGRFIDAEQIERRQPMNVTDIIRFFPGFRIVESEFGRTSCRRDLCRDSPRAALISLSTTRGGISTSPGILTERSM
jgi:hypothetical protein